MRCSWSEVFAFSCYSQRTFDTWISVDKPQLHPTEWFNEFLLQSCITFEVRYYSPDGKVGMWDTDEFQNPLTDYDMDEMDDGTVDSEAQAIRSALAETASLRSGVSSHAES